MVQERIDQIINGGENNTGDLEEMLTLSNSWNRMYLYYQYVSKRGFGKNMDPQIYWKYLGEAYTMSDGNYKGMPFIRHMFLKPYPFREYLMNNQNRIFLNSLPNQFSIYRGCSVIESKGGSQGISWTLDKKTADFFAYQETRNRYRKNQRNTVIENVVTKDEIIAYFGDRGESEIIYIP